MKAIVSVHKPISFTPNQMIEKVRERFPHFAHEKIGYAGRLDPMARGVLLLLVGDANFEREQYLHLDKTYQFTAILGIETDSYDLLGLVKEKKIQDIPSDYLEITQQFIEHSLGKQVQPYPPFSTKPVQGKELFKWARENRLSEIEIPTKEITIYDFKQLSEAVISAQDLEQLINERIEKVEGFFRQEEILHSWQHFFESVSADTSYITVTFEVSCSSGTYVRSLVHNLGQLLGCGAVTLDINRTRVGTYHLSDALQLLP